MAQGLERLRRKRDGYALYSETLRAQLEALDAEDLDAFARLADQRDLIAARIDAGEEVGVELVAGSVAGDESAGLDRATGPETVARLRVEARQHLEACLERDEELRLRLRTIREEVRGAIQELGVRGSQLDGYRQTGAGRSTRLDIRL